MNARTYQVQYFVVCHLSSLPISVDNQFISLLETVLNFMTVCSLNMTVDSSS